MSESTLYRKVIKSMGFKPMLSLKNLFAYLIGNRCYKRKKDYGSEHCDVIYIKSVEGHVIYFEAFFGSYAEPEIYDDKDEFRKKYRDEFRNYLISKSLN